MVPTLKLNRDDLLNNGFLNAYIKDNKLEAQYNNCIYLLFKPPDMIKFSSFIDQEYEKELTNLVDDYDYPGGHVVLVYQLNSRFKEDFELVKKGRYSKTSLEFQKLFPQVLKIFKNGLHRDEVSLQWRIFKKSEDLREYWENKINVDFSDDMEVWDTWEEDKEILDINKFNI